MNTSASFALDSIPGALAERGLAWRGAFHPESDDKVPAFPDGAPALTVCLLGWTGSEQWPAFARSPEASDGFPDPLNRWSKQAIDSIAGPPVCRHPIKMSPLRQRRHTRGGSSFCHVLLYAIRPTEYYTTADHQPVVVSHVYGFPLIIVSYYGLGCSDAR